LSIEIRKVRADRRIDLKDGIVLDGLPSTGLVNAIASECLLRSHGTELFAVIDSPDFPPISIISDSIPQFPIRLHVNEGLKVAFFISGINIPPFVQGPLARTIMRWTLENQCKIIISAVGISDDHSQLKYTASAQSAPNEESVLAVGSNPSVARIIEEKGFVQLRNGTVGGIGAVLLNECSLIGLDVILLVVKTITNAPDFRAAALVSNAINRLVPSLYCDIDSLMGQAKLVEDNLRQIRDHQTQFSHFA
jgi:uncharacterized protein